MKGKNIGRDREKKELREKKSSRRESKGTVCVSVRRKPRCRELSMHKAGGTWTAYDFGPGSWDGTWDLGSVGTIGNFEN